MLVGKWGKDEGEKGRRVENENLIKRQLVPYKLFLLIVKVGARSPRPALSSSFFSFIIFHLSFIIYNYSFQWSHRSRDH
jgi:hypothetical protein